MSSTGLSQLETLVEALITSNQALKEGKFELENEVHQLKEQNETLQLEVLEAEEKQITTEQGIATLLGKLQGAQV